MEATPFRPGPSLAGMAGDRVASQTKDRAFAQGKRLAAEQGKQLSSLVFLPTLTFMFTLFIVYKLYLYSTVCTFIYALVVAAVVAIKWKQSKGASQIVQKHVTALTLVALFLGLAVGLQLYYQYWVCFYRYRDLPRHANVFGSQPADAFSDAGMIEFSADTMVDASRSVGYQSIVLGKKLCVAPIVDSTLSQNDPVSFFAVGEGCCSWRGGFSCDDAGDPRAKFGLLHLDPYALTVSPLLAEFIANPAYEEGFQEAFKLNQAVYGTVLAKRIRAVRWTRDPIALENTYWNMAAWRAALWCVAVAGACSVAAYQEHLKQKSSFAAERTTLAVISGV